MTDFDQQTPRLGTQSEVSTHWASISKPHRFAGPVEGMLASSPCAVVLSQPPQDTRHCLHVASLAGGTTQGFL